MREIVNKGELSKLFENGELEHAEIELYFTVQFMERDSFMKLLDLFVCVEEQRGGFTDMPNIPVYYGFTIKAEYGKILKWNEEGLIVTYASDYDGVEHRLLTYYNRYKDDPVSEMLYIIDGLIGIAEYEESISSCGANRVVRNKKTYKAVA